MGLLSLFVPIKVVCTIDNNLYYPLFLVIINYFFPKITKRINGNIIIERSITWLYKYNHDDKTLSISCINMTLPEWSHFFSKECTDVYSTPRNTFRFWLLRQRYKQMLKLIHHGQL